MPVKMDIEDTETLALSGATRVLETSHPMIFLSTHGHNKYVECAELLNSLGYTLHDLTDAPQQPTETFMPIIYEQHGLQSSPLFFTGCKR